MGRTLAHTHTKHASPSHHSHCQTLHHIHFPAAHRWHRVHHKTGKVIEGQGGQGEGEEEEQGHCCGFFRAHEHTFHESHTGASRSRSGKHGGKATGRVTQRLWNSRQHRKGKVAKTTEMEAEEANCEHHTEQEALTGQQHDHQHPQKPKPKHPARHPVRRARVFCLCNCWTVPVWSAFLFTLGSAFWVCNGIFGFHSPAPASSAENESSADVNSHWAAATGFFGGLAFFIGGWTTLWEALNQEDHADFDEDETTREQRLAEAVNNSKFLRGLVKVFCCGCFKPCCKSRGSDLEDDDATLEETAATSQEEGDVRTPLALAVRNSHAYPESNGHSRESSHDGDADDVSASAAALSNGAQPRPSRSPKSPKQNAKYPSQFNGANGSNGHSSRQPDESHHVGREVTSSDGTELRDPQWRWFGWNSIRDLGFMVAWTQWAGTQIFFISVLFGWPATYYYEEECCAHSRAAWLVLFWVTQIVGATFLTISSVLMTLESQSVWYRPRLLSIPWHIGFWNIWGSVGFLLSGLGGAVWSEEDQQGRYWGVFFTTYVGSYSYFLGSVLQYIEARYL